MKEQIDQRSRKKRTRKYVEGFCYFGMKLTIEEKQNIKQLAVLMQSTATQTVIQLVKAELERRKGTAEDIPIGDILAMNTEERNELFVKEGKLWEKYGEEELLEGDLEIIET